MYLEKVNNETVYAVFSDNNYMSYNSIADAINVQPRYIVKELSGSWKNGDYYNFGLFHLIFNDRGEEIVIKASNWRTGSLNYFISGASGWYGKDKPVFQIIAPDGQIREEDVNVKKKGIEGIIQTIILIECLTSFANWKHYDTEEENNNLKIRIKELEAIIDDLKKKH